MTMQKKYSAFYKSMPHIYTLFSVLGYLLFMGDSIAYMPFLAVGASSPVYLLVLSLMKISFFALGWIIIPPLVLIMTYLFKTHDIHLPFFLLVCLDTLIVCALTVYQLCAGDVSYFVLIDLVISAGNTFVLWKEFRQAKIRPSATA